LQLAAPILPVKTATNLRGAGDSPALGDIQAMTRSTVAAGFTGPAAAVASPRLMDAVAASLAIASLSLV
jgi:hypothetical protein